MPGRIVLEYAQHWSDLGAHYLPHYVMSAVGPAGSYWILNTVTRRGVHLTTSGEVRAVPVAGSRYNVRQMPFRLTPAAIARGAEALQWRRIDADNQKLHAFFRTWVYGTRPLPELAKQGTIWAGVFLVIGLLIALPGVWLLTWHFRLPTRCRRLLHRRGRALPRGCRGRR